MAPDDDDDKAKGRNSLFVTKRYICQFPTHIMSCILCLPFIKIITHANGVLCMYRVTEIVCMSNNHY